MSALNCTPFGHDPLSSRYTCVRHARDVIDTINGVACGYCGTDVSAPSRKFVVCMVSNGRPLCRKCQRKSELAPLAADHEMPGCVKQMVGSAADHKRQCEDAESRAMAERSGD